MKLTMLDLKSLVDKLHKSEFRCDKPVLERGENSVLIAKPRGRKDILRKHGHEVETIGGVLHVKVPLGVHGRSQLVIDPETGIVSCACGGK